jgi:hypothetical protein
MESFQACSLQKLKGCDFGYALAVNSCEGVSRRGRMYRHSLRCDHCFRSSKPRRTSRNAVDFFGSGGCPSRLVEPITQSTFRPATCVKPTLSTVDTTHPNTPMRSVNTQDWCTDERFRQDLHTLQLAVKSGVEDSPGLGRCFIHIFFTETRD